MQNMYNQPSKGRKKAIITALFLFSLAGLLAGFTFGAAGKALFPAAKPQASQPVAQTTATTTPVSGPKVPLNCPVVDETAYSGIANGAIQYTFKAHAVDKSGECAKSGNPIESGGITCKLWLSEHKNGRIQIPSNLWPPDKVKEPLPGEISGALVFDPGTPQTQMCNEKGQGHWKFGVSASTKPGKYFLVIITDWDGTYANWSWVEFTVTKEK
ncbi:hypothetical protein EI42_00624 [Thermosporothrix hazakensis]|jgi:hypothetical protein|uniref:Uncharacterized protein n=2 Tax=Thermosporothrix TaxID=768650 RepID=A0A326UHX0_THEHA|nr:hypothetical protein EI42_00624 [Thermosporothrix hazakensis]